MDAKFIATMYRQQYGDEAVKILEKLADLTNDESVALKNKAETFQAAAKIITLLEKEGEK